MGRSASWARGRTTSGRNLQLRDGGTYFKTLGMDCTSLLLVLWSVWPGPVRLSLAPRIMVFLWMAPDGPVSEPTCLLEPSHGAYAPAGTWKTLCLGSWSARWGWAWESRGVKDTVEKGGLQRMLRFFWQVRF